MLRLKPPWSEQQVEEIVGNLLRAGVNLAAVVVAVGGILYVVRHGGATPVARVAFSVFAFMQERDLTYVIVTLIVLTVLLHSLIGGHV